MIKITLASVLSTNILIFFSATSAKAIPSFELSFSNGSTFAEGLLQFETSNLTGIGKESATLSDLDPLGRGTFLFDFDYRVFDTIFDGTNDVTNVAFSEEPIFYFDSGNLVGINLKSDPANFAISGCRSFPCTTFNGTISYELKDDKFQEFLTGSFFDILDPFTEIERPVNNILVNEGMIQFATIEPIPQIDNPTTIPESLSIFGLFTTVALGLKVCRSKLI